MMPTAFAANAQNPIETETKNPIAPRAITGIRRWGPGGCV
jgi:hypothetical protein